MTYLAIVSAQNGKIAKYAAYPVVDLANQHVNDCGGFVFNNANDTPIQYITVDWAAQTATAMSQSEIDAEQAAELDALKDQRAASEVDKVLGDIQRRALNVLFDTINTVRTNAGQQPITLQQYVTALNGADGPITRQQFVNYVKAKL